MSASDERRARSRIDISRRHHIEAGHILLKPNEPPGPQNPWIAPPPRKPKWWERDGVGFPDVQMRPSVDLRVRIELRQRERATKSDDARHRNELFGMAANFRPQRNRVPNIRRA